MIENNNSNLFNREVQHFRQPWLWILILSISAITIWGMIQQLFLGKPFGNNPAPDATLVIIVIIFGLGFPYAFYKMNLTTEVRSDGIYYRFFPFHLSFHKIKLEDLAKYEVRTYSPIRDYGGWGIRWGTKGKAYNVSGNRGVHLSFSDGEQLLIGSQKPEEFAEALDLVSGKSQS
ncbi:DUF6141 family protein [Chloroflexota bacterium]